MAQEAAATTSESRGSEMLKLFTFIFLTVFDHFKLEASEKEDVFSLLLAVTVPRRVFKAGQ